MFSGEGEEVEFAKTMYPTGNVEEWMLEIENCMKESMRLIIKEALQDYKKVSTVAPPLLRSLPLSLKRFYKIIKL